MKPVIRLFLFFFPLLCLYSCNKDSPEDPAPRDSYDIRDPGLSEQYFGQVKWIFNLHIGQTKIFDIDGKRYVIKLSDVDDKYDPGPNWWKNAFCANLDVNGTKVNVITYRAFNCKPEENMAALCNENILSVYAYLKRLFANPDKVTYDFWGTFGFGSLIDDSTRIFIGTCYYRLFSDKDEVFVRKEADIVFIIVKQY